MRRARSLHCGGKPAPRTVKPAARPPTSLIRSSSDREWVMYEARAKGLRPLATLALLVAAGGASAAVGFGATIVVNTPNDEFGTVPGNCSLREAVQTANTNADFGGCTHTGNFATGPNSDVVQLLALDYPLARDGKDEDANSTSDLDTVGNITIRGAGPGVTSIFLCGGCEGRIVHVLSGTNVDIEDVTLKFGRPIGDGAGLYNNAVANLTVTRVTIGLNETGGNGGSYVNVAGLIGSLHGRVAGQAGGNRVLLTDPVDDSQDAVTICTH